MDYNKARKKNHYLLQHLHVSDVTVKCKPLLTSQETFKNIKATKKVDYEVV